MSASSRAERAEKNGQENGQGNGQETVEDEKDVEILPYSHTMHGEIRVARAVAGVCTTASGVLVCAAADSSPVLWTIGLVVTLGGLAWLMVAARAKAQPDWRLVMDGKQLHVSGPKGHRDIAWTEVEDVRVDEDRLEVLLSGADVEFRLAPTWGELGVHELESRVCARWRQNTG